MNLRRSLRAFLHVVLALAVIAHPARTSTRLDSTAGSRSLADATTIVGTVVDDSGQPVEHATVFVYKAGVKNGFSVFCPTCWVDCGKRAFTDANGAFTIGGVDRELKFTLLVAMDAFSVARVESVDPSAGPVPAVILKPRAAIHDASRVMHGRVVDIHGDVVADALVEPRGIESGKLIAAAWVVHARPAARLPRLGSRRW